MYRKISLSAALLTLSTTPFLGSAAAEELAPVSNSAAIQEETAPETTDCPTTELTEAEQTHLQRALNRTLKPQTLGDVAAALVEMQGLLDAAALAMRQPDFSPRQNWTLFRWLRETQADAATLRGILAAHPGWDTQALALQSKGGLAPADQAHLTKRLRYLAGTKIETRAQAQAALTEVRNTLTKLRQEVSSDSSTEKIRLLQNDISLLSAVI